MGNINVPVIDIMLVPCHIKSHYVDNRIYNIM